MLPRWYDLGTLARRSLVLNSALVWGDVSVTRKTPPRRQSMHKNQRTPSAATSWDPVANWYRSWVGKEGSVYHQKIVLPSVFQLLNPSPEETILDIGCGNGVLASHMPEGVHYIGIDASPRLLATAKAHFGNKGRFLLGDAANLPGIEGLKAHEADAAVFVMSIQDMKPLEAIFAGLAWALNKSGRVVIMMMHPCFRIPRQSGWGWDEGRKLQYRRIDSYLSPMEVPVRPVQKGTPGSIMSFHRPLQDYINGLVDHGFILTRMLEIPTFPQITRSGPKAKAENRSNREIPTFLGLQASKAWPLRDQ